MNVPRKRRDWLATLQLVEQDLAGGGNVSVELLASPEQGEVELTVARIVGTIVTYPQNFTETGAITAGIFVAPEVGGSAVLYQSDSITDLSNKIWLWQRMLWNAGNSTVFGNQQANLYGVDIKVMRKIPSGSSMVLQMSNTLATGHHFSFNLRMLLLK